MDGSVGVVGAGPSLSEAAARPRRIGWKQGVVIALWAVFVLWTGYGAVTNLSATLSPPPFSMAYATNVNLAAPLFALNVWGCASVLLLAFVVVNPLRWLNGKRLVLGCTAFALMLGRLASGFAVGPLAYAATIDPVLAFAATPMPRRAVSDLGHSSRPQRPLPRKPLDFLDKEIAHGTI